MQRRGDRGCVYREGRRSNEDTCASMRMKDHGKSEYNDNYTRTGV